jgi:hypothetical protein
LFIGTQFAGVPREEALSYFGDGTTAGIFIAANVLFWASVWRRMQTPITKQLPL